MAASEHFVPPACTWRQAAHLRHKANVYNTLKKRRSMIAITTEAAERERRRRTPQSNSATLSPMLFMVIERFPNGDPKPVGERFKTCGRMLPAGVTYQVSWMEATGAQCFQLMDAPSRAVLNEWVSHWNDLVDFDIIPVVPSADFWANIPGDRS